MGTYVPKDMLLFIKNVGFGAIHSRGTLIGLSRTYKELVSTGNLSLISNDHIRNLIMQYYYNKDFVDIYMNNLRSDYASYINSLKAYNPNYPDMINQAEIPRILEKMKTDEFHSLINQELTYTYSIERSLKRNKETANELHKKIEQFLSDN